MKYLSIILICLFTLLNTSFASQYGSISGYFLDEHFEALPGGDIQIVDSKIPGESDKNGYFKILGLDAGIHTIKFMFIGYAPVSVHNVKVLPDSDTEIIICLAPEELSDPPSFFHDYDGSYAKTTPYNPSQKNIDLEKTGKVDIKEKSKYPKLDFADKFYIIQKGLNNLLPAFQKEKCEGRYLTGEDGFLDIFIENNQLKMRIFDSELSGWYYSEGHFPKYRLFHVGENKFSADGINGYFFINNDALTFIDRLEKEKVCRKFDNNTFVPYLLLANGRKDEAIAEYRNIYKKNINSDYISFSKLYMLYELFKDSKNYEAAVSISRLSIELYPDQEVTYKRLAEVFILLKDYKSALEAYKEGLKHDKYDHFKFNDLIKELEEKLK